MKLSIEQANKLLSQLIAGVTVVADEQQADKKTDIDAIHNNIAEVVSKNINPELQEKVRAEMEAAFTARYLGTIRSAAGRIFNIPRRELDDLSPEQLISKCKGTIDSRYNKSETEQQTALEATIQDYETQIEQLKAAHEEVLEQERGKYTQRDITSRCMSIVEQLPRKGGDLQEQADMLRDRMQKVYEVRYNEDTKRLEFYNEGKPALTDKNEPVNDEDFARTWAERAGILVRDTRHISPADVQAGQQGGYLEMFQQDEGQAANGMNAIEAWVEA